MQLRRFEKKQVAKLGMSKPSDMTYVNTINRLCDAVDPMQEYLNSLHDAIKDLEAEITRLKQDLRH